MGNGNQKAALTKHGVYGPLPKSSWLHIFSNYLSVKELREVVFVSKAFSEVAIEAYPHAKKNRISKLSKIGALKLKPLMKVEKKAARTFTFLSNGHLALLIHEAFPEIHFYDRWGDKIDYISAWAWPAGSEKQRYDNIADLTPMPKGMLAVLDSGKKQVLVINEHGAVKAHVPLAYRTPVAMTASPDGTLLHVADQLEQNITTYSVADGKQQYQCRFQVPTALTGLVTNHTGDLLIPNPKTASIRIVNPKSGEVIREIGDGPARSELRIKDPRGVDIDPKGRMFIADSTQQMVFVMDSEGRVLHSWGKNSYFKSSQSPLLVRLRDDGSVGVLVQGVGVVVF